MRLEPNDSLDIDNNTPDLLLEPAVNSVLVHKFTKSLDLLHLLRTLIVVEHHFDLFEILDPRYKLFLHPVLQTAPHKITRDTLFSSTGHHIDKEELLVEVKSLEEGMRTNQFDERDDRISKFVKEKL